MSGRDPGRGIDKADGALARVLPMGEGRSRTSSPSARPASARATSVAALAQAACRNGYRALCTRVPRLLHELAIARGDGTYVSTLQRLAQVHVLVLDDFLIAPMKDSERRDLLEVLEDRYGRASTVITTQVPTKNWHEGIADPTIAVAICDRLVHNAHVLRCEGHREGRRRDWKRDRRQDQQPTIHVSPAPTGTRARRCAPTGARACAGTSAQARAEWLPRSSGIRKLPVQPAKSDCQIGTRWAK